MLLQRGKRVEVTNLLTGSAATRLAQWIGCFGVIWNAKVHEDKASLKRWLEAGKLEIERPIPNQTAAQFLDESRLWLKNVPSQIRRNAASKWFEAKTASLRGLRKIPRTRRPFGKKSALITAELFLASIEGECLRIAFRSSQKGSVFCVLTLPLGQSQQEVPRSIWVSRIGRRFFLSWSYEFEAEVEEASILLNRLALSPHKIQEAQTLGIDLGVAKPLALSDGRVFELDAEAKAKMLHLDQRKRRYQRRLARCKKGSKNRRKNLEKSAKAQSKTQRIRHNFAHQASKTIAESAGTCVVMESLKITNMVRKPKAKPVVDCNGVVLRYEKNRAAQKAGLNKALLNVGWSAIRTFLDYKLRERNKFLVLVSPYYSSQECYICGHIDAANRQTQAQFKCIACGYQNNADINASLILKKRFLAQLRDGTLPQQGKAKKKIAARKQPRSTTPPEERCQPVEPCVRPGRNLGLGRRSRNGPPARAPCREDSAARLPACRSSLL